MGRVLATAQEHPRKFSKAEIDAVIAASPRTTVPFNKLVLSPGYQARPAGTASRLSVAELAACPLRQTSCRLPFDADDPRRSDTTCKEITTHQSS